MTRAVHGYKRSPGFGFQAAIRAAEQTSSNEPSPIQAPPTDVQELLSSDFGGEGFILQKFDTTIAIEIGNLLYARLLDFTPKRPSVISISTATGSVLFQVVTGSGIQPDNAKWVERKRNTVIRFGVSSWFMGRKFNGDEPAFAAKYGLSPEKAAEYAIHGGGIPIYVPNVEGVVGVIVVSGLKQDEDHGVIAEIVRDNFEPMS